MTTVICISGKAGSGKDTLAGFLKERLENQGCTVMTTHYADLLKFILEKWYGWDGVRNQNGRYLLQTVGTDVIRAADRDFFVRFIDAMIGMCGKVYDYILIPDLRFPNELSYLREHGKNAIHVHIERPTNENSLHGDQEEHSSETAMDSVTPDYAIHNNGTLHDLMQQAADLVVTIHGFCQITIDDILTED